MTEWGLPTRLEYEEATGQITNYLHPIPFSRKKEGTTPKGGYVEATEKGIAFYFPNLYGGIIKYLAKRKNNPEKEYVSIRLMEPKGKMKYQNPWDIDKKVKQRGTYPLITPRVLDAYEDGTKINNLYLIEGPAKALKADHEGIMAIGLQGKDNFTDVTTGKLHKEILDIIEKCKVQSIILLLDGDAREVKYEEGKDLAERPQSFFYAVKRFKSRCMTIHKQKGLKVFFMQLKDDGPKGLDDLFVYCMEKSEEPAQTAQLIKDDLYQLAGAKDYFIGFNLMSKAALKDLKDHFCLSDVTQFYDRHVLDVAPYDQFIWQKDTYQCDEETDIVGMIASKWSNNYFAVGPDFYLLEQVRDRKTEKIELMRTSWTKGQIVQRHVTTKKEEHLAPLIFDQIKYYSRWFFEPDHFNYKAEDFIPGNDFGQLNRYHDVGWNVDPSEKSHEEWKSGCPNILTFLHHIFQIDDKIEEGLDWLRLLYEHPKLKLNCLCLVSNENETGKSTFGKLLKEIYKQNCLVGGNQDLLSQFNAIYADRLVFVVDEAKIDDTVKERLKKLITEPKIAVNDKNTKVAEMDYHGKIVLMSNFELDFMSIDEHDNRFFVVKVPSFKKSKYKIELKEGEDLMEMMTEEVRDFIGYLMTRPMKHPKPLGRFWIPFEAIKTKALARVIEYSLSDLDIEIGDMIRKIFDVYPLEECVYVELKTLTQLLNKNRERKHEKTEVLRFLRKKFPGLKTEPVSLYKLFVDFDEESGEIREEIKDCRPYKLTKAQFNLVD